MSDSNNSYAGQAGLTSGNSGRNSVQFQAEQHLAETRTMMPVKIMAVHGGGVGPDPTVDVQIMVNQVDGQNNATPHGTVYGIAAPRNQSGNGVVINDPIVGDLGYMHVADRDISAFRAANGQASPGSKRRFSPSDGVFVRGHNGTATPKQFVQFRSDGVTITDVNGNKLVSDKQGWHFTGPVTVTGNVTAGFGTGDSVTLQNHTHPTTPPGPASAPTPGT